MNCLIFGINGQDGYYLQRICEQKQIEVVGIARSRGNWVQGNVEDFGFVEDMVKTRKPNFLFHVAANSTTLHEGLFENHKTISTGTLNVLEAVRRYQPECRVFITGSGVQFINSGLPIKETHPFEAKSPYSVARIQSVYAARYFRSLGIKAYVGYLFHHESSLRKPHHVSKMITDSVKKILAGRKEMIVFGDVSVRKEWAFAGDIAEGIFTLVNQDAVFESSIGTGIAYSIENWLEICFKKYALDWKEWVRIPEKNEFKAEYKVLVSDPSTMFSLGWKNKVNFEQLADLMLNGNV
jgi:GDPmannose 4,6-dehydratase